jgi:uncharacterized membrane protein
MDLSHIVATIHSVIEIGDAGIESLAVLIIVIAILFGSVRFVFHLIARCPDAFDSYKVQLGKALLLGLELLVAADVVRTVAFEPTLASVAVLGILVLIRTFLSLSTIVEIEGRWPWNGPRKD